MSDDFSNLTIFTIALSSLQTTPSPWPSPVYGFQRLKKDGPYKGAYHHQLFVRGKPELLTKIKRVSEMDIVLPPGAGPPQDK